MLEILESEIKKTMNQIVSKIEAEWKKKFRTKTEFANSMGKSPGWLNNKLKEHRGMKIEDLILIAGTLGLKPEELFPKNENQINVEPIIECVQAITEHTIKKYFENKNLKTK